MQSKTALAVGPVGDFSGPLPSSQTQISSFSKLIAAIRSKLAAIDGWQRERDAIAILHQMDDHMLSDIGINRSEIEHVVRNRCHPGASAF